VLSLIIQVGCQISNLIFEKKIMEGGLYKYPMKIKPQVAKDFAVLNIFFMGYLKRDPSRKKNQISMLIFDILLWTWGAETHPSQLKAPGNIIVSAPQVHSRMSNINFDIWL
jgi:hypothetical protein